MSRAFPRYLFIRNIYKLLFLLLILTQDIKDADDVPTVKKAKMHDISLSNESSSRSAPRKKGESNSRSESFKLGSIGAHPASGLSLLAESASRLPLTADRPNMREQLLAKAVEKKQVITLSL
jgi:hypothetical protein